MLVKVSEIYEVFAFRLDKCKTARYHINIEGANQKNQKSIT